MRTMTKDEIFKKLISMRQCVYSNSKKEVEGVSVTMYSSFVRTDNEGIRIWSDAFQAAINENECIVIPASDEPYYIDKTITVPSNRCIEALDGAVIRLKKGTKEVKLKAHGYGVSFYPIPVVIYYTTIGGIHRDE
jgi:hypothetical protein